MRIVLASFAIFLFCACAAAPRPIGQKQSKSTDIAIGSAPEQVLSALGKPDRKYMRKTAEGDLEVWAWVMRDSRVSSEMLSHRDMFIFDVPAEWYYLFGVEHVRTAFKDGKVVFIDRIRQW